MKISSFKTDTALEVNGVWVDIGEGASLLVARVNNPKFVKEYREKLRPYRHSMQKKKLASDVEQRLVIETSAKTILLDWKGLTDDEDNEIVYSVEKATELLTDLPDFRELVLEIANNMEAFRREEVDTDQKN